MLRSASRRIYSAIQSYHLTAFRHEYLLTKSSLFMLSTDIKVLRNRYFLAETLKYLLLMFGSPERMRLDEVVFTTEGE